KVGGQRLRFRVGEHTSDLLLEHSRRMKPPLRCLVYQLIVRNAAPQEERKPRGQFEITDAIYGPGGGIRRIRFDVKHELRARQDPLQRNLNGLIEAPCPASRLKERKQAL